MAGFSYSLYCCHLPALALAMSYLILHCDLSTMTAPQRYLVAAMFTGGCLVMSFGVSLFTEARTASIRAFAKQAL